MGGAPEENGSQKIVEADDLRRRFGEGESAVAAPTTVDAACQAELTGGQQQRMAVARALISRPTVVFADEPTGNLDSKTSNDVLDLLRQAVDDFGQTVVMVSHDANAASFADRLLVLADGRIVHDGGAVTAEQALDLMKSVG